MCSFFAWKEHLLAQKGYWALDMHCMSSIATGLSLGVGINGEMWLWGHLIRDSGYALFHWSWSPKGSVAVCLAVVSLDIFR